MEPQELPGAPGRWFYVNCFFVTVATVLGTGILGLPVELDQSGFWPFLCLFVPGLGVQAILVCLTVELLQFGQLRRSSAVAQKHRVLHEAEDVETGGGALDAEELELQPLPGPSVSRSRSASLADPNAPLEVRVSAADVGVDDTQELRVGQDSADVTTVEPDGMVVRGSKTSTHELEVDLHFLGTVFLRPKMRPLWNASVMLHFVAILSSYSLAGPQALGEIFSTSPQTFVALWVVVLGSAVVFGKKTVLTVISSFTFVKGCLLVVMVALTGVLGSIIGQDAKDDWSHLDEPFLISTVALGGVVNVMPVLFTKVPQRASALRKFRTSILLGLLACFVLNVLWAAFVLECVPQDGDGISLKRANHRGEISTVPLVDLIEKDHRSYLWISWVIRVFIAISVFVSFLALGSGMVHVLEGYAESLHHIAQTQGADGSGCVRRWWKRLASSERRVARLLYVLSFGFVLAVASANPSGFLKILSRWASLALNLESGLFVALMTYNARAQGHVELQLPRRVAYGLIACSSLFFGAAVLYDMVVMMRDA